MADNKLKIKSINDLLGMNFFIPNYQRGYRWTEQQVKDLLNDIWEFYQKDKDSTEFYCLQPVVVRKRNEITIEKIKSAQTIEEIESLLKGSWEVIDGQQRLTTIYIILSVLNYEKKYLLEYETKDGRENYLNNICPNKSEDNIDNFHIFNASKVVKDFFNDENKNKAFKESFIEKIKFIWYESVDEDPIKVFTRLNIGKIPLTNAELIKALLLNSSNFNEIDANHLRLRQQEIASEWDKIEYTLQKDEFWLFLHPKGYDKPTRIDFIFNMIVDKDILNIKNHINKIGSDEYHTFRYFYEYFSDKKNEEKVRLCWSEVKKYFQTFQEWFNDLEMYHYVGFLVEQKLNISEIYDEWKSDKKSFIKIIKEKIKEKIKGHSDLNEIYEIEYTENGRLLKGVAKTYCKSVLLLHNIQTIINQTDMSKKEYQHAVFYKFPFHLYKIEGWDVEHIDSDTENDLSNKESQNEFLLNIYHSVDYRMQQKIKDFINGINEINWSDFAEYANKSDNTNTLTQEEKNQIWNFTLLDSSTNRSYGNSIFSAKRRIIIGKDRGVLLPMPKIRLERGIPKIEIGEEQKAKSAFIPPCTKQIFLKYYSPVSTEYNYWTKSDAEAYRQNIYEVLKDFGVKLNIKNNG